jgi:hypothetical protein
VDAGRQSNVGTTACGDLHHCVIKALFGGRAPVEVAVDASSKASFVLQDYRPDQYAARPPATRWRALCSAPPTPQGCLQLPAAVTGLEAWPNPFNPTVSVAFELERTTTGALSVYDVSGRKLVELARGTLDAGRHVVVWNGRDSEGRALSSGTYIRDRRNLSR